MCTVSVIHAPTLRIACNRDELLTRPDALQPRVSRFGDRSAMMPVDPVSGGTWIAVNDAGVAFTLLNVNPAEPRPQQRHAISRGLVIPSILHSASPAAAQDALVPADHEPFRLIVLNGQALLDCLWDGARLRTSLRQHSDRPAMFTSSGLGDHLVTAPRTRLFESLVLDARNVTPTTQDQFHRHRWADAPQLSVCMNRGDARTVSYTTVEITSQRVALTYLAGGPRSDDVPSHWCLERA